MGDSGEHQIGSSATAEQIIAAIEREQSTAPDRVGDALLRGRGSRDAQIRAVVLIHLPPSAAGDPEWRAFLHESLADRRRNIRKEAAEAVGRLQLRESIPELVSLLNDPDELVRVEGIESLWEMEATASAPHVERLLRSDPHALVRGFAATVLADLSGSDALPVLEERLRHERSPWARAHLLLALCALGRDDLLTELLRRLRSKNPRVRCSIANGIDAVAGAANREAITEAVAGALERETNAEVRTALEQAFARLRG
jgi:HEAT repeat protein